LVCLFVCVFVRFCLHLITTNSCLNGPGLGHRANMMNYAIDTIMALPHTAVFIDAGQFALF
jgi:hypothetical protein